MIANNAIELEDHWMVLCDFKLNLMITTFQSQKIYNFKILKNLKMFQFKSYNHYTQTQITIGKKCSNKKCGMTLIKIMFLHVLKITKYGKRNYCLQQVKKLSSKV